MPTASVPPSQRRTARVRRLLWRRRHALLAAAVTLGAWVVVHEVRPPPPPTADVRTVAVPDPVAAPGMLRSTSEAVGERVAVALPVGFPLAAEVLVGPGLAAGAPAGDVVVPVRLADAAVARALRPGDRVDLLSAAADAAASAGGAEVVAAGALVVARDEPGGGGGLLGPEETAALLYVAVPRASAPGLVGASAWAPLRVVLP